MSNPTTVHGLFTVELRYIENIGKNALVRAFHEQSARFLIHRVTSAAYSVSQDNKTVRVLVLDPLCTVDGARVSRPTPNHVPWVTVVMQEPGTGLGVATIADGAFGVFPGHLDDIEKIGLGEVVVVDRCADDSLNGVAWRVQDVQRVRMGGVEHHTLIMRAVCDANGLPLSLGELHYGGPAGMKVRRAVPSMRAL